MFPMKPIIFAVVLLLSACNGGKNAKDEPILAEARKIHNEAIKIHKEVMTDLKEVKKIKADSEAKLKDLDEKAKDEKAKLEDLIKQCDAQQTAMGEWMANIQEVPAKEGEEHDHHDHEGHDHNHDHKPAPQVSATEMLAYQKEMKKNIEKLQQDVKALLKK